MKRILASSIIAAVLVPVAAYAVPPDEQARAQAEQRVSAARDEAKVRSFEAKQAAQARRLTIAADKCSAMKDRLAAVVPRLGQNLTSVKSTLDKSYDRIKAAHDKGTLTVSNYNMLVVAVDAAKAAAETSMNLVDPSSVTVDCAAHGLGTQLDSYRSTIREARTALKEYRQKLVDLISAMSASSDTTKKETDNERN